MKAAIKEEFGDSVKIVESDEIYITDGKSTSLKEIPNYNA